MRAVVSAVLLCGCQSGALGVGPDRARALTDAVVDVAELPDDAVPEPDSAPPPKVAHRRRFVSIPLSIDAHGIDGAFELWRDERIDDALVAAHWYGLSNEFGDNLSDLVRGRPLSAQLVLRDVTGRVRESLDLGEPTAKLEVVHLGEKGDEYLHVSIDTARFAANWEGTTHRFVRVTSGSSQWLNCASAQRAPAIGFWLANDGIGRWRHERLGGTTTIERVVIADGACTITTRAVKGWVCSDPAGPC